MSKLKEFKGGLEDRGPCPIVLGIDQSYTGFAITALNKESPDLVYHTWVYKADGTGIERLKNIQKFLKEIIEGLLMDGYRIVDTGIEGYNMHAQLGHMAGELGAIVKLTLNSALKGTEGQYPLIVAPMALKKYVTGKGNAQKSTMMLHTFKTWGVEFDDDNACDSFGLALVVSGRADFEYQKQVLEKLQGPTVREKPALNDQTEN